MRINPGLIRRRFFHQPLATWGRDRPLLLNAVYIFGVSISAGLFGLVYWAMAGRWFQPEEIGLASGVISVVTLLAGFGALGFGYGLLRFLPEAEHPLRLLNTVYTFSCLLAASAGLVFLSGSRWWFPELSEIGGGNSFPAIFLLFIVSVTLGSLVRDSFVARRQARYAWRYTLLAAVARLLLLIPLIGRGAAGLVASSALAYTLALVVSAAVFLPAIQPGYRPVLILSRVELSRLLPFSSGNYMVVLITQLSQTMLPLLVIRQLGLAAGGYAYIALMVAGLLTAPGVALSTSALVESANSPGTARPVLRQAAGIGMLFSLAAGGLLYLFGPWGLQLFGPNYAKETVSLLRLLALSIPLFVLVQFYFTYLRFRKMTRRLVLLAGLLVFLTLGAVWVWLPALGIAAVGAGILFANLVLGGVILLIHRGIGLVP